MLELYSDNVFFIFYIVTKNDGSAEETERYKSCLTRSIHMVSLISLDKLLHGQFAVSLGLFKVDFDISLHTKI